MTECFTDVPGPRSLTIALAFDPPVRHRRFDYLAYQMDFLVVRATDLAGLFEMAAAGIEDPETGRLGAYEVKLRPTRTVRSRGMASWTPFGRRHEWESGVHPSCGVVAER
jgi:hypothetical protein